MQSLEGGVGQRRRRADSNTALELGASSDGVGEEGGSGADNDKGGGWRQRMVRTIVSVVLRIRAVAAGLGAMLGLGRWTKVGPILCIHNKQQMLSCCGSVCEEESIGGKTQQRFMPTS